MYFSVLVDDEKVSLFLIFEVSAKSPPPLLFEI